MITVSAKEFRHKLSFYLDQVERGEEITIIRNSYVIGHLKPTAELQEYAAHKQRLKPQPKAAAASTGVSYRQMGVYDDATAVGHLHQAVIKAATGEVVDTESIVGGEGFEHDLLNPAQSYESLGGEFWVGEQDGHVVAAAGFKIHFGEEQGEAELKRFYVHPEQRGRGIGSELLELVEARARECGFTRVIVAVNDQPDTQIARQFYLRHGYVEASVADGLHHPGDILKKEL